MSKQGQQKQTPGAWPRWTPDTLAAVMTEKNDVLLHFCTDEPSEKQPPTKAPLNLPENGPEELVSCVFVRSVPGFWVYIFYLFNAVSSFPALSSL